MDLSAFHFSIFAKELFLKPLTLPKFGQFLPNTFRNFYISYLTKTWIDFSGFAILIDKVDGNELKRLNKLHNDLYSSFQKFLAHSQSEKKIDTELIDILQKNCDILEINIARIEDKLNKNYNYAISVSGADNDWNSPENDHWDNY